MAEKFHASISEEPSTGSVRGKIPSKLVQALGAEANDVIEFTVKGDIITRGRVLSSKEAREYKNSIGRGGATKKKTTAKKSTKAKKAKKKGRKTEVEYDAPKKAKKKAKKTTRALKPIKKKGKKGKKR